MLSAIDREEILRTREAAIQHRRISAETSRERRYSDRLGLRRDGVTTQAAQVLYGTRFMPDYPQCLLKMGRFRGTKITGDILADLLGTATSEYRRVYQHDRGHHAAPSGRAFRTGCP